MENLTIAVVGGSGFVGQHIVRELQMLQKRASSSQDKQKSAATSEVSSSKENNSNLRESISISLSDLSTPCELLRKRSIKEIRVLDINPFKPNVEISEQPPVKYRHCDIRLESKIFSELEGVDAVFHCAGRIPSPDRMDSKAEKDLLWETNLEGTENVVWACRKADIKALVYTSTIGVVMGGEKIVLHTEHLTPQVPESKLLGGTAAKIRVRSERAVLEAHKTQTDGGGVLLTTALRPTFMYGEGDTRNIPLFVDIARKAGGKMPLFFMENAHHFAYVGNVALAHVEALFHLLNGEAHPLRNCGGLPVYINDDSPSGALCDILPPFLSPFGLQVPRNRWSYYSISFYHSLLSLWISLCSVVGVKSKYANSIPPQKIQLFFGTTTVLSRTRAELAFNYRPFYPVDEAVEASLTYYRKILE